MPQFTPDYRAPRCIPGRHLQTILPARFFKRPVVTYRREEVNMPDGDFMIFDWAEPAPRSPDAPVLVHFHGLEGDSRSHYAEALMDHCVRNGVRGVVAHFRSCGGKLNRLPRAYFAGDTADNSWVLKNVHARFPHAPFFAVGVSLGGNQLAKCLGDLGKEVSFVTGAASIGAPVDLVAGTEIMTRGANIFYGKMFLSTLKKKAEEKARLFPDIIDARAIRACKDLYDFDNVYTAPIHGFRSGMDYWTRCSAKPVLGNVQVPLLLLNAKNDPFLPAWALPSVDEVSRSVYLDFPDEGGHIGFPIFVHGRGSLTYLPNRIFRFFREALAGQR